MKYYLRNVIYFHANKEKHVNFNFDAAFLTVYIKKNNNI